VGTFLAWKADSLVVESYGDTLVVSLDSVTTLEVRPVERSIGKAAAGGLLFGALIGGLVGAAVGLHTERSFEGQKLQKFDCDWVFGGCRTRIVDTYKEQKVVSPEAVAIGAAAGGLLGLIIGVAIEANRWVAVSPGRLGLNVGPQRDGRFGFGASVRF
jgi:outer membrane lipoprotein SlyB